MATCAASGMILADDGWLVPGVDGLLCAWHADVAEMSGKIAAETPEHWLLDQIALAYTEPCPNPGAPPAPPEPVDIADEDAEHERQLLNPPWLKDLVEK